MQSPAPRVSLVATGAGGERADARSWTATAVLGASGVVHLVAASTVSASGVLQVGALVGALALFAAAGFLACLALTGQHPSDAVLGLLLAGTVGLLALDLLAASGLAAAGAVLAGVVAAASVTALLSGVRRRRAADLLLGLGALVWLLWLAGLPI